jgi:MATE family multidrug resistance protein
MEIKALNREILRLAVPSILANLTVPLVGMVDIAVAGHLTAGAGGAAALIGGISIGTMLFDLLYWNFSFLRVGTGGLTAQAFGRGDMAESKNILWRALLLAWISALLMIAIQWLVVKAAFLFVTCTPEVQSLATRYFYIRIWAAPATLSLFALKGWFIGMQDTVSAMAADLIVNIGNMLLSVGLAFGLGMGFDGVAWGTVIAQWSGFLFSLAMLATKYRRVAFAQGRLSLRGLGRFFAMNGNLVLRSLGLIAVYIGFTVISARYGDTLLAVSSILMKILLIFSYFTDGFAYAGEALTGKAIGMGDRDLLFGTIRYTFIWSMSIAVVFIGIYAVTGVPLFRLMTSDTTVVEAAREFLPWLLVMPLLGCPAFTWDGIYLGATASGACRNTSLLSAAGFFAVWLTGLAAWRPDGAAAIHLLMAAYFVHLAVRTLYQTVFWRKYILSEK